MEFIAALGLVALALIVAVCAVFLFTVQPIWRIAEMAASEKQLGGAKKLLIPEVSGGLVSLHCRIHWLRPQA